MARLTVPSGPYRAIVRGNATSVNFYAVSTLHQNGMGHDFFRVRLSSPQGNWVFKAFVTGPNIPNTGSAIDLVNGTNRFEISYSVLAKTSLRCYSHAHTVYSASDGVCDVFLDGYSWNWTTVAQLTATLAAVVTIWDPTRTRGVKASARIALIINMLLMALGITPSGGTDCVNSKWQR